MLHRLNHFAVHHGVQVCIKLLAQPAVDGGFLVSKVGHPDAADCIHDAPSVRQLKPRALGTLHLETEGMHGGAGQARVEERVAVFNVVGHVKA